MHQPLIIQHLFQVSTLEDVSRERLEAFVEAYPSYGIGHYLLSCKLQAEGSERFLPETQRTCLYFSNPLWLQWLLQNTDGQVATQPVESPEVSVVEPVTPEPVTAYIEEPAVAAPVETADAAPTIEEGQPNSSGEPQPDPIGEPPTPPAEAALENVVTMAEEAFSAPAAGDDLAEVLTAVETTSDIEEPSAAERLLRSIEEARGLRESLQQHNEDFTPETAVAGETLPAEPEVVLAHEEPAAPQEDPIRDEEAPFVLEETEEKPPAVVETAAIAETTTIAETPAVVEAAAIAEPPAIAETPVVVETPAAVEAQTAPEETKPAAAAATQDFLFEPYHTIDYFASQGIKFTLDDNPADKLGKQLKSFTEWLKTMRRLPQKDREVVPDRVMEEAIQTSAAHSIQGKDVLTETMAEVLAKQGMREKARAVYEKLSLLNPDKRAYFAAKIEQLNIP